LGQIKRLGRRYFKAIVAMGAAAFLGACETTTEIYEGPMVASVGNLTSQNRALRQIAPPDHRQMVAVYGFPDLTGQYKERDRVQSLSRAVTQAGAPLLIKALQDAAEGRWFSVVVQERQIIERMRQQYRGEDNVDPSVLGPMMHAGMIITGGIVGYDTNMTTGGYGARYLGIGANSEWKYDVVSVNIRAVSTETGEVLANVLVRKPIASVKSQGDIFRYIELDKLLEAEAGYTTNEPRQIAVQQAVEKAVMALIAEGAIRDIWDFADHRAEQSFIQGYREELFNEVIPASAQNVAGPRTRNAAAIPQTRPVQRPSEVTMKSNKPESAPKPPPAANGETLG
jgi:curli production assembly/transport component CsgG